MSQPVVRHSEAPLSQPTALPALHPSILPEYADTPSDSSASTSECPYCASPPLPGLEPLAETIPDYRLDAPSRPPTLECQFLGSVRILPAAESSTHATAIVPQDRQASGHWLLVDMLCHRVFDACGGQGGIRNFAVLYYGAFCRGDVLTAASRKVIQDRLTWLQATVTRDGALVATATALYDSMMDDGRVR